MGISFEIPEKIRQQTAMTEYMAQATMRPFSRELDENEHARPTAFVEQMWPILSMQQKSALDRIEASMNGGGAQAEASNDGGEKPRRSDFYLGMMHMIEALSWGDAGIYLCLPSAALGGSAIEAVGTPEQKLRLLRRFAEGEPTWGAMAMTEPGAGSDTSAIQTTAVLDEASNEWVLNGEKIFCTSGGLALNESDGLVIVWATIDRKAGRAGMKPFVVEAGSPGVTVTKAELKHGIRASDTVSISLNNARIPADNILGSAEVKTGPGSKGFKGAMATFDASRPLVAASALGIGRAALEFVKEKLAEHGIEIPSNTPRHRLTALQRDVIDMEAQMKAAHLLTLRAVHMLDEKEHNPLEASMAKLKAGKVVTQVTQKAVELLGPLGYSREWLVEKWMRDGKINDIYEGTGQINTLIVARRILDYGRSELA
jgi:acyl-CoA dehydrogenase